jgi:hypothetical protein
VLKKLVSLFNPFSTVIDPDVIARQLDPMKPSRAPIASARQADSFVLESMLPGKGATSIRHNLNLCPPLAMADIEAVVREQVRLRAAGLEMMPVKPERKVQLETYAKEHWQSPAEALD